MSIWSLIKRGLGLRPFPSEPPVRTYRGLPEIDDPLFGPMRWTRGCWKGRVQIPALGADAPLEVDRGTAQPTMPSDDQRACYQDFLSRCNEQLVERIQEALYKAVSFCKESHDLFGREKAAADCVKNPADVWTTLHDLGVLVDASEPTVSLCWSADWEDEHGVQVLYREGGDLQVGAIGDLWSDDVPRMD